MSACPQCGQPDVDASHQCPPATAPDAQPDEQAVGMRGATIVLTVLALSFALFVATIAFTMLHQQASAMPVVIQTTLPATDATATDSAESGAVPPTAVRTATPASRGGGQASQPTPTPTMPLPATLLPTAVPPTPTNTPQPTPTRLPQ